MTPGRREVHTRPQHGRPAPPPPRARAEGSRMTDRPRAPKEEDLHVFPNKGARSGTHTRNQAHTRNTHTCTNLRQPGNEQWVVVAGSRWVRVRQPQPKLWMPNPNPPTTHTRPPPHPCPFTWRPLFEPVPSPAPGGSVSATAACGAASGCNTFSAALLHVFPAHPASDPLRSNTTWSSP